MVVLRRSWVCWLPGSAIPFAGALGVRHQGDLEVDEGLPHQVSAEPLAQRSRVLDTNGNLIATFYDQNRVNVPLSTRSRR